MPFVSLHSPCKRSFASSLLAKTTQVDDTGGGAVYLLGMKPSTISRCSFLANTASNGGGLGALFGTYAVYDSLFDGNQATGYGANNDDAGQCPDYMNNGQHQIGSGGAARAFDAFDGDVKCSSGPAQRPTRRLDRHLPAIQRSGDGVADLEGTGQRKACAGLWREIGGPGESHRRHTGYPAAWLQVGDGDRKRGERDIGERGQAGVRTQPRTLVIARRRYLQIEQ